MSTTATTDVVVASSAEDARAVEAVKAHHAELAGQLAILTEQVVAAAGASSQDADGARARLVRFCTDELVPHALAEESTVYAAAATRPQARLLIDSLLQEHTVLTGLVEELRTTTDPVRAAAAAYALRTAFDSHLVSENELVLPVVAADPSTSLAGLLDGMHELLGGHGTDAGQDAAQGTGHGHGSCGCGHQDEDAVPELDVRAVPHAIRHATVFGAFDAIPAGESMVLVAPHDPLPLLKQLNDRAAGRLAVSYQEQGPEAWRLLLTRG